MGQIANGKSYWHSGPFLSGCSSSNARHWAHIPERNFRSRARLLTGRRPAAGPPALPGYRAHGAPQGTRRAGWLLPSATGAYCG